LCWGRNNEGQIGDATKTDRSMPTAVTDLRSGQIAVASCGWGWHTCSLSAGGSIKCWGRNASGQLGDNSTVERLTPAYVVGFAQRDPEPELFGFVHKTGVSRGEAVTSNVITPAGYDSPAWIDVFEGEYSIGCNGAFTGASGTIRPGQSVCVSHTASSKAGATVTTTLTIGGIEGTFSSTTATTAAHLTVSPSPLAFGGQSMYTTSVVQPLTVTNMGVGAVTVGSLETAPPFAVGDHDCGNLAPNASCTAQLTFRPPAEGSFTGGLRIDTLAGAQAVPLSGEGERSLVTHYYAAILGRLPDPAGKAYWTSEAARVQGLGADLNEVWYAMTMGFFNSAEYLAFNRSDGEFITDLYRTFLNREPDIGGRDYWLWQISQGLTREVILVDFMFSPEFKSFTTSIFGDTSVRRELDAVMDFYRGLLSRLPDDGGFGFWVNRFRAAQCAGEAAVTAEAEAITGEFARGAEYAARNRDDIEYVGDLYNAVLRRGGDPQGVRFWINLIASGAQTREQVRQQFVQSPEFQARVQQIIAAGCLP